MNENRMTPGEAGQAAIREQVSRSEKSKREHAQRMAEREVKKNTNHMDNRQFNINGGDGELLALAIKAAFIQAGTNTKCIATAFDVDAGLILLSWPTEGGKGVRLPVAFGALATADLAAEWLCSEQAKEVKCVDWDRDCDHDGHNALGWRVYVGDWGQVGECGIVIAAVKPAYLWFGK